MTENPPPPENMPGPKHMPGDIVNGHILGSDGYWVPIGDQATAPPPPYVPPTPPKTGLSTAAKVGIGVGTAFGLLVMLGIVGAAFGLGDDEAAAPAAPVTESATPTPSPTLTPTPEPTTAAPIDPDDAIRETSEYRLVQAFMDKAMKGSGADLDLVCLTYGDNPGKYDAMFIRTATKNGLFSYDVAIVAVPDWFATKCGT